MRFCLSIIAGLLLCFPAYSQVKHNLALSVYSNDTQSPVESANIHSTLSGKTYQTDGNGFATVPYIMGDTLIISHAEYKNQILAVDKIQTTSFTIYMENSRRLLDEVVINTGYEQLKKIHTTGSYEVITETEFNRVPGMSVISKLDGVAGSVLFDHRPGKENEITIRGISSLGYAPTDPLIILDNFPYEGDINAINPNDIETVTILKDAAASSIWGARAGNGVIILTTKKSRFSQPLKISLNSSLTITPRPNLFLENRMSTKDFIDVEEFLFNKGFYDSKINDQRTYPALSPVVEILNQQRNNLITEEEALSKIDQLSQHDVRDDFEKYFYRTGFLQQYALNVSGGSDRIKYYLSGGYDTDLGNLVGQHQNRVTLRSVSTFKPVKRIEVEVDLGFTKSKNTTRGMGGYNDMSFIYPYTQLADENGDALPVDYQYRGSFTDTAGNGLLLDWKLRPLDEIKYRRTMEDQYMFMGNLGIRYSFTRDLNFEFKYQYNSTVLFSDNLYEVDSYVSRNYINQFTQITPTGIVYNFSKGGINPMAHSRQLSTTLRGQINYDKKIAGRHEIRFIGGGEIREATFSNSSYTLFGYDENLNTSSVDNVNRYPTYDNIAGQTFLPGSSAGKGFTLDRYFSVYSTANYTYNNIYSLSLSARHDASNLFGVKANQKGVPLWSAGGAWNISSERFYGLKWLPYLRARLTFGYSGNVSHSAYAVTVLGYSPANDPGQNIINIPYVVVDNLPNAHLKWETVGTINLGIDFGLKNNRLSGSLDFFRKKSSDVLGQEEIDPTAGSLRFLTNSASLSGKGLDISLNSGNIITTAFQWNTQFKISYVKTVVSKYLYPQVSGGFTSLGFNITPYEGFEPYNIVAYKYGGLDSLGNPLALIDGKWSTDYSKLRNIPIEDQVIHGTAVPHVFGSLINSFRYKNLILSINTTFRFGYYFFRPVLDYNSLFSSGAGNKEYSSRWQHPGDENFTNVPAMIYPDNSNRDKLYQYADINVEKADHIRLNDIRASYSFSETLLKKYAVTNLELFASVSNINIILWKANNAGLDPEFLTGLKPPVQISFGLKTTF